MDNRHNSHPCAQCGKMMVNVHISRRYCEDCSTVRHRTRTKEKRRADRQRYLQRREQRRLEQEAAKPQSLDAVSRAADAAGMSYGQYVARMAASKTKK